MQVVSRDVPHAKGPGRTRAHGPSRLGVLSVIGVAGILGIGGCGSVSPTAVPNNAPPSSSGAVLGATPLPQLSSPASPGSQGSVPAGRLASTGSIAVLGNDGSLSVVDDAGRSTLLATADQGPFTFPAWSPDGSRVAAIRSGPNGDEILVFHLAGSAFKGGEPIEPVTIFRSAAVNPFYLAWTPDGRNVSFLASGLTDLELRLAPADGSAPLDGSEFGAVIRTGSPFYYDWIAPDRLLAHIGVGTDALVGEIGLDGVPLAPGLPAPGIFDAPVVSPDDKYVSYVRADALDGSDNATEFAAHIVVAARDGSGEHSMPEFGAAAVEFDPAGDTIASIGAIDSTKSRLAIPVGPLRLMDAGSGAVRTILDGLVLGFWWSPDGRTIAALRVEGVGGASPSAGTTSLDALPAVATPSSSPGPSPSAGGDQPGIRLVFVDVASGAITSRTVVQPGPLYGDQLLTYFDQYAVSHRLWAPDSSSVLVPVTDDAGATRIAVMYRNGDAPVMIDGAIGFWSP